MIFRQHASTSVPELKGVICDWVGILPHDTTDALTVLFLRTDKRWVRIFFDVGVFFLDECRVEDTEEHGTLVDISSGVVGSGATIESVVVNDGCGTIEFGNGKVLTLRDDGDRTTWQVAELGQTNG